MCNVFTTATILAIVVLSATLQAKIGAEFQCRRQLLRCDNEFSLLCLQLRYFLCQVLLYAIGSYSFAEASAHEYFTPLAAPLPAAAAASSSITPASLYHTLFVNTPGLVWAGRCVQFGILSCLLERRSSRARSIRLERRMSARVDDRFIAGSFIRLASPHLPRHVQISNVRRSNCVIASHIWRLSSILLQIFRCKFGVHRRPVQIHVDQVGNRQSALPNHVTSRTASDYRWKDRYPITFSHISDKCSQMLYSTAI